MSDSITVDTTRLPLLLQELRLSTVAKLWPRAMLNVYPEPTGPPARPALIRI